MYGNIELAPLCGMAERIVDITATGTTLRENNLVIIDEVLESSARFVGNPASVRIDERVRDLAERLEQATREDQ
jgi:ATP phosphoribosyltransferase regulatory subunit